MLDQCLMTEVGKRLMLTIDTLPKQLSTIIDMAANNEIICIAMPNIYENDEIIYVTESNTIHYSALRDGKMEKVDKIMYDNLMLNQTYHISDSYIIQSV